MEPNTKGFASGGALGGIFTGGAFLACLARLILVDYFGWR